MAVTFILALSLFCVPARGAEEPETRRIDIKKPVAYSFGGMAVGLPLLMAAGTFDSGPSLNNFTGAFKSAPVWENDSPVFNYVLHPLWGSETYLRAREANWGIPGSIAFTLGMSFTWEYLIESWVEHPSTQDLIFTTGIGWMIGEVRYALKQRTSENWHWVIDPINTTLDHLKVHIGRNAKGQNEVMFALSWKF